MSDPITLAVLAGAAAGGAAGKFTEIALESGKHWIGKYFNNHQPKSQEKAQQNGLDFLTELAIRIKVLEESNTVTQEKIENIQEDPDFSAALQKALISSAQTENKEKHKLLAEILSQRLTVETESLLALTTKMALDVVSFLTPNQLNILAVVISIFNLSPTQPLDSKNYDLWLNSNFKPYLHVTISNLDLMHLESLSCLKINPIIGRDLRDILTEKNNNISPSPSFFEMKYGKSIKSLWDRKLETVDVTSVGLLIGMNIYSLKNNTPFPKHVFN
ncbi:LPO_1073/Vpar_1526 family protein [Acinetobacter lwoffii]|uniref:LPO_1073/Vpar_1526 family protein n=1 Tax=Acinetobacter lwoffii TaxID=28090 RepID=UPI00168CE90E|nr:LPO_1073/Vpar_1526 family protein [Acinetobacter lwoffii]